MGKVKELNETLKKIDIPQDSYSLGCDANEALCLIIEEKCWIVYYSEKGNQTNKKIFLSEDEACEYFLYTLKKWFKICDKSGHIEN